MEVDCLKTVTMLLAICQLIAYNIVQSARFDEEVTLDEKDLTKESSSEFCHINNFSDTGNHTFHTLVPIHVTDLNETFVMEQVNIGMPFVVSSITKLWRAVDKWDHTFFKSVFRDEQLFSSTFSTLNSPEFCDDTAELCEDHNVYYGVFLNNPRLAEYVHEDYQYPEFIPEEWWVKGMSVHS